MTDQPADAALTKAREGRDYFLVGFTFAAMRRGATYAEAQLLGIQGFALSFPAEAALIKAAA